MYAVNLLESFDIVVAENLAELVALGRIRYSGSSPTALKLRRSLGVQTDSADFEIILWESGEVEFGYGEPGESFEEHLDLTSDKELRSLMNRFVETAQSWGKDDSAAAIDSP